MQNICLLFHYLFVCCFIICLFVLNLLLKNFVEEMQKDTLNNFNLHHYYLNSKSSFHSLETIVSILQLLLKSQQRHTYSL